MYAALPRSISSQYFGLVFKPNKLAKNKFICRASSFDENIANVKIWCKNHGRGNPIDQTTLHK